MGDDSSTDYRRGHPKSITRAIISHGPALRASGRKAEGRKSDRGELLLTGSNRREAPPGFSARVRDREPSGDYIVNPKNDGYRSHHLMLTYKGRGPLSVFTGRTIELQVRTRLQHSWATSIEAVGLFRREELKNNQGSADWLRLFKLMSAEFSEAECCPLPPDIPGITDRR
ncbi:MAG: RelA/SpoT domain-containing protein [Acetobacteraceae bacterium]|nr:RelA/SpoT domain-containing protein [Acetobacteraceae bacterium]